jgi:hypothetical protein
MKFYIYDFDDQIDYSVTGTIYYICSDKLHGLSFNGYYVGSFNSIIRLNNMNQLVSFRKLNMRDIEKLKNSYVKRIE